MTGELTRRQLLLLWWEVAISVFGFAGVAFIVYGVVASYNDEPWPVIERVAPFLSSLLTLVGTFVTAASIYGAPHNARPPEFRSRYITAPLVIVATSLALAQLATSGILSPVIVNGFAILGLAGGLFRMNPGAGVD